MNRDDRFQALLEESLRAHVLMFETPLAPIYGNAVGIRMLVAFLVVAIGLFFALRLLAGAAGLRGAPVANLGFVVALQTELTRRFGAIVGLLVADVVFTFGPLHLNYLIGPGGVRWGGLAAIFGIGLFFGIVYYRSGNLWIPAVLHGLWPPNMT